MFPHNPVFFRLFCISLVICFSTTAPCQQLSTKTPVCGSLSVGLSCEAERKSSHEWGEEKSHFFLDSDNLVSSLDFSVDTPPGSVYIKYLALFMLNTFTKDFFHFNFCWNSICFSNICFLLRPNLLDGSAMHRQWQTHTEVAEYVRLFLRSSAICQRFFGGEEWW